MGYGSKILIQSFSTTESSRYAEEISGVAGAGDRLDARLELTNREMLDFEHFESSGSYDEYTVIAGDRIDSLAALYLGDSRLWWVIVDLNPIVISDALYLSEGSIINIPTILYVDSLGVG